MKELRIVLMILTLCEELIRLSLHCFVFVNFLALAIGNQDYEHQDFISMSTISEEFCNSRFEEKG